jgi:starch synthase
VLNGIDQHTWDPATDPQLPAQFSTSSLSGKRACKAALQRAFRLAPRPDVPLFALCARLVAQKGIDTLLDSGVLDRVDAQFILLGEGEAQYTSALAMRAVTAPESIGVQLDFSDRMGHLLLAGGDACLVPSVYEPCGLTQMRAQRTARYLSRIASAAWPTRLTRRRAFCSPRTHRPRSRTRSSEQ